MKKIKKWIVKTWNCIGNWIVKALNWIENWITKYLLILSIATPIILIVTKVYYPDFYGCIKGETDLDFYQIIVFVGAVFGLLWTNKRYKQGQENLKKTEESLEQNKKIALDSKKQSEESLEQNKKIALDSKKQSEEIAFKNKMNTQYLEVIKAISDKDKKKTPIVSNLINAIQVSIAIFYDTEEKKKKARKEILNFNGINLTGVHLKGANLTVADLRGAHLRGAYLIGANLTGADLTGAYLTGADFNISSLNALSRNQLDSAKNVTEIKIYIHSKNMSYSLNEFVEMNPANSITDYSKKLKKDIFDYLVKLSKQN